MIRHIIFDIGNVLTDFRWKDFLRDKGFSEEMIARIAKASTENVLWRELDRGEWSFEKLMQAFIAEDPEIARELHRAFDDMRDIVTLREYAIPWVVALKKRGYQVWYLSNFSQKVEKECPDSLKFLPYMDGGILSYREKLIKPDPKIYELLMERYGLKASESVFLDDTATNIDAAKKLGMHGIVFRNKEQAEEVLERLLQGQ